jgi:hypothetical protein
LSLAGNNLAGRLLVPKIRARRFIGVVEIISITSAKHGATIIESSASSTSYPTDHHFKIPAVAPARRIVTMVESSEYHHLMTLQLAHGGPLCRVKGFDTQCRQCFVVDLPESLWNEEAETGSLSSVGGGNKSRLLFLLITILLLLRAREILPPWRLGSLVESSGEMD